ncbi:hypothetical protein L195_g049143, partial [Trifolium pratense]
DASEVGTLKLSYAEKSVMEFAYSSGASKCLRACGLWNSSELLDIADTSSTSVSTDNNQDSSLKKVNQLWWLLMYHVMGFVRIQSCYDCELQPCRCTKMDPRLWQISAAMPAAKSGPSD